MQNTIEVIAAIIVSVLVFALVLWGLVMLFQKFFGVTLTTRSNLQNSISINNYAHEHYIKEIAKYDEETINAAKKRLRTKHFANTSENLLNEIHKVVEINSQSKKIAPLKISSQSLDETVYLHASNVKTIMQSRTLIPITAIEKSCYITIDSIGPSEPFLRTDGDLIYTSFPPHIAIQKKLVRCKANSELEMQKPEVRELLKQGILLDKQNKFEEADLFYKSYLSKVQLRFTLLSNNNLFEFIKPGDQIIARVEHVKKDKYNFLTLTSSTVRKKTN